MHPGIGRVLLVAGALSVAGMFGFVSHGLAQGGSAVGAIRLAEAGQAEQKGGQAEQKGGQAEQKRTVTPKREATPKRTVTPKREVTPKRTVTPKREVTPKVVSPKEGSPRVGSGGPGLRAISTGSTGRVSVRGQNYTVWRGSHRVRYGNRWRTFGALSALSILFIGGATYYPYAYLSAPQPVCEGETEDGCVLQWQEVETVEGPREFQCVAYCPWQ